jgi:hypothetical protein
VAIQPSRRRSSRGLLAAVWKKLGPRRQLELFWWFGFAGVAFPGSRALRAKYGSRSRSKLFGLSVLQAARTLLNSTSGLVQTLASSRSARGRAAPARLRSPAGP